MICLELPNILLAIIVQTLLPNVEHNIDQTKAENDRTIEEIDRKMSCN